MGPRSPRRWGAPHELPDLKGPQAVASARQTRSTVTLSPPQATAPWVRKQFPACSSKDSLPSKARVILNQSGIPSSLTCSDTASGFFPRLPDPAVPPTVSTVPTRYAVQDRGTPHLLLWDRAPSPLWEGALSGAERRGHAPGPKLGPPSGGLLLAMTHPAFGWWPPSCGSKPGPQQLT